MKSLSIFIIAASLFCKANTQDSLSIKHLQPITYTFDIVDGELVGQGSEYLKEQMSNAQFTMIGEYHGSKRISEFTNAIIPVLDSLNYKTLALEVGPVTGKILNSLGGNNIEKQIREIHEKYLDKESDGYVNVPFPFFDFKEDAQFLQNAKGRNWNVFGIDQEYYVGYVMLLDKMYNNMSSELKPKHQSIYNDTRSELKKFYINDQNEKGNMHLAISESKVYKDFLASMQSEPMNIEIIDALEKSSAIYLLNHRQKWYENNATRIKYMKSLLRKGLRNIDFDITKDKMMIKMGGYHLSKGFSPLSLYEVGNTLNEIAEFHGNTALNIGFMTRFHMEESRLKDTYYSDNNYYKNHNALLEMGKKSEWVVIDLRKLIKGYFYYPKHFHINPYLVETIQRYDLIVIPKTEVEGILNYN